MKVGEWYTNPSSSDQYLIRVTVIDEEVERGGEHKTFNYFYIGKNKMFGIKNSVSQSIIRSYEKIKEKGYIEKLEKFYNENNGPSEIEQLDDFIDGLDDKTNKK